MLNQETILLIIEGVREASEKLLELYLQPLELVKKADGSPVTNADQASSDLLMGVLQKTPYPFLCEEIPIPNFENRKNWETLWILDPLDGTKGYIHRTNEFAIALGLVHHGTPIFGVIADPCERRILVGGQKFGLQIYTWEKNGELNSQNIPPFRGSTTCRVIKSRSKQDTSEQWAKDHLKRDDLEFIHRSSALKFFDLVEGKADIYIRQLPSMEWDICAGQAILESQGGKVLDLDTNKSLQYNKKSLFNPNFQALPQHFHGKELDLNN